MVANARLTYKGFTRDVYVSADNIVDAKTGENVALPASFDLDTKGNILVDGVVVGTIAALPAATGTAAATGATSSSSGLASQINHNAQATAHGTTTEATNSTVHVNSQPLASAGGGDVSTATRSIEDGGARTLSIEPTDPHVEGKIDPTGSSGGSSGGDHGGDDTTSDTETAGTKGKWGEGNPQHEVFSKDFVLPKAWEQVDKVFKQIGNSTLFTNGMAIANKIFKFTGDGKVTGSMAILGKTFAALQGAAGAYQLMTNPKNAWGYINLGMSAATMIALGAGPLGWIAYGIAVAAGIIAGLLRPKQDNAVKAALGDVIGNTNTIAPAPPNWGQVLPNQSIYMMLAGITALSLNVVSPGKTLDLSNSAPAGIRQEIIPPSLVPTFNQRFLPTMQAATNTTITGGSLLGKVFIKKDQTGGSNDKVVYVTEFTKDDGTQTQAVNVVSLNKGGVLVSSEFKPGEQNMMQPFFAADQTGNIKPNPQAFNDLGQMNALANASANGGLSPEAAARANFMAALMGRRIQASAPSNSADTTGN